MGANNGNGAPRVTRRPVTGGPLPGLEGFRVLDLSDDVAGAYCAKLLSDAGAAVRTSNTRTATACAIGR